MLALEKEYLCQNPTSVIVIYAIFLALSFFICKMV